MNNKIKNLWIVLSVFAFSFGFFIDGNDVSSKSLNRNENSQSKSSKREELRDLTARVVSLITLGKENNSAENIQSPDDFTELAKLRYDKLSRLIENDPAEILRVSLPEDVLSKIDDRFADLFEKREHLDGEMEVVSECDESDGRVLYYLNTEKGRLSLYFAKQPKKEFLTGAKISVEGVRVGEAVAVEDERINSKTEKIDPESVSALPNTFGEQKVLVLLVNFQNDQRQPYTVSQATSAMETSGNYFREVSYQKTWLTSDVFGWFTLPINSGDCTGTQTAASARQAAVNAGIDLNNYNKIIYAYPQITSCNYGGRGTIGGSEVWINGNFGSYIVSHELGHNFGLYHARALDCGAEILGNNCTTIEYGNTVNTMGATVIGHYHSFQKEQLGWLNYDNSPSITTVQSSGNYFITPMSTLDSGAKALKILKTSGTWYYVEVRRQIGFDSSVASSNTNGVILTMNKQTDGQENYLLDTTPSTSSWNDAALAVNQSFTDSSAGVTITPVSVDNSGALVNISFGAAPPQPSCAMANPTVSANPSTTQWMGAGSSVSFSVTVKNNNSSNCTDNNFKIQPTLPSGWTSMTSSPVLNVSPGASATTTVQVNAPSGAANGFYSIVIGTSNYNSPSYAASASIDCSVYSSLGVSASSSQQSYTRTQTASVTAYISANASPMAGANVTFTVTKPNGNRVTTSVMSAADGSAVYNYKFNKKQDPAGTYYVSINANLNGVNGNGSTSFVAK